MSPVTVDDDGRQGEELFQRLQVLPVVAALSHLLDLLGLLVGQDLLDEVGRQTTQLFPDGRRRPATLTPLLLSTLLTTILLRMDRAGTVRFLCSSTPH